ncbi:MAG: RHS repeat-associated core domain-containing protein [Thermoanaerobaculia bacterium]
MFDRVTGAHLRARPGPLPTILYSKFDARGHARRVQDGQHDLAFTYDAAERLTQVAQADASGNPTTPVLKAFSYATANGASNWKNGKLETATAYNPDLTGASVVETYTYGGVAGRVSARQTQVEGRTINQSFAWTDLGPIGTLGYPDDTVLADPARPVSYGYSLGYLTSVGSFLTSLSYHANGMVHEALHANGMKDVFAKDANDMPRPAQISVQRVSDGAVLGSWGPYDYDGSGNVKAIGADTFTYDLVSRLTTGTTTAGANRQCADYNAFGALKALGTGTSTCTASPIAVDNATNRLSSPALYDAAGNLTNWGGYSHSWNRLNQMYATTGTGINRSYGYTADGERILERNALDDTRTLWIRDLSGRVLREYGRTGGGTWSWSKDYVHRDGPVVSTVTPSGTRHLHLDHLGSVRGASDTQVPPQPILPTVRDYYPFGLDALAGTDAERMRFAGHERDTRGTLSQTDDLDYMHARYYSPVVGRFLSIDPGRDWNAREPQSWNLFSYARNSPTTFIDPFGLKTENGRVIAEAGVTASDPAAEEARAAEAARRAMLELRLMRLRSNAGSSPELGLSAGTMPTSTPDEYSTYDLESFAVNSWRGIAAFEDELFLFGTVRPFERLGLYDPGAIGTDWSGTAGSVVGDVAAIAAGATAAGLEINLARYANSGGGGFNVLRGRTRLLGLDWHKFKKYGRLMNRPHVHLKGLKGKHWPW